MYDTHPYIDPVARMPGFHDATCRVTWSPRGAAPPTVVAGPYLDAESASGTVYLGCGIEAAIEDLGIGELVDYEHLATVADLVSEQLTDRPWAEVRCRHGTARIELLERAGS